MTILHYCAMTREQFDQLVKQLNCFHSDRSKNKRLYEIQFSAFDLDVFERPSNPKVLCVHRKVFDQLIGPEIASKIIERAFGSRVVEFVPLIKKGCQ